MKKRKGKYWTKSWRGRLGPLQVEIMHLIFRYGKDGMSARDIFEIMYEKQKLPNSSVYTVLNRLIKRGLLERKKFNSIYRYYPLIEEKSLDKFGYFEDKVYKKGAEDIISRLLQKSIANNLEEIERLQKLLDQEREKLKTGE